MPKFTAFNTRCTLATYLYLLCKQDPFTFPTGNLEVCVLHIYLGGRLQSEWHRTVWFLVCVFTGLNKLKGLNFIHVHVFVNLKLLFGLLPSLPEMPIAKMSFFILCYLSQGIYKSISARKTEHRRINQLRRSKRIKLNFWCWW